MLIGSPYILGEKPIHPYLVFNHQKAFAYVQHYPICDFPRPNQDLPDRAIARAKALDCHLIQLTTDKQRPEALEFYKKLGFIASHESLKLHL